jgi:hypothetical protein
MGEVWSRLDPVRLRANAQTMQVKTGLLISLGLLVVMVIGSAYVMSMDATCGALSDGAKDSPPAVVPTATQPPIAVPMPND